MFSPSPPSWMKGLWNRQRQGKTHVTRKNLRQFQNDVESKCFHMKMNFTNLLKKDNSITHYATMTVFAPMRPFPMLLSPDPFTWFHRNGRPHLVTRNRLPTLEQRVPGLPSLPSCFERQDWTYGLQDQTHRGHVTRKHWRSKSYWILAPP